MKNINKLIYILAVFTNLLLGAQLVPQPVDPTTGGGVTGTGSQSIPVDMYVYVLAVVAIMLVVFFAKKYKSQKI